MAVRYDLFGRRQNPAVQINTSVTNLQLNQIDVSNENSEPQFMEEGDRPLKFFKDQDPMYWRKFDPQKYAQMKEAREAPELNSQKSAENLNPVLNG